MKALGEQLHSYNLSLTALMEEDSKKLGKNLCS